MIAALLLSVMMDVYVDPLRGNDANDGATRATAVRTLDEAWQRIPRGTPLTNGVRIQLLAGDHARETVPVYFESRYGTADAPIIIQSADGPRTAHVHGDFNIYDTSHLQLVGLDVTPQPAGDVIHCEQCRHFTIRDCHLDGGPHAAQEVVKVNQSDHVVIEDSNIHGAWNVVVDFVAVQYGRVSRNRLHDADDWCMYAKGGSAYFLIEDNEMTQCGTGGFSAGQGTGFQYMVSPWLHYEAYGITAIGNWIHDTEGAGLGVNGGYNILYAYNTLERVGSRSHRIEVVYGARSCDGPPEDPTRAKCDEYAAAGGWRGPEIPNRNVFIVNNVLTNPPGFSPMNVYVAPGSDENLQIRGNTIDGVAEALVAPLPVMTWDDAPQHPRVPPPAVKRRSTR